jgi:hypothetical protein
MSISARKDGREKFTKWPYFSWMPTLKSYRTHCVSLILIDFAGLCRVDHHAQIMILIFHSFSLFCNLSDSWTPYH